MESNYVELKCEPAGELYFGKLYPEEVEELRKLHGTEEYNNTDLAENPTEFTKCIEHRSGMTCWDYNENYKIAKTVTIPKEDGFYIVCALFSKYSMGFDIPGDKDGFDSEKVSVEAISFDFDDIIVDTLYDVTSIDIITDYKYNGVSIEEAEDAEMIDRGIDKQVTIFQVKNEESKVIYQMRHYHWDEPVWDDFLD